MYSLGPQKNAGILTDVTSTGSSMKCFISYRRDMRVLRRGAVDDEVESIPFLDARLPL